MNCENLFQSRFIAEADTDYTMNILPIFVENILAYLHNASQ